MAINQTINYRHDWWGLLDNKIATCSYLSAYGLPVIPILAVYCANLKTGAVNIASNEQQLHEILTNEANYPMFGKPTEGLQSLGSIGLQRYLPATKSLETREGRSRPARCIHRSIAHALFHRISVSEVRIATCRHPRFMRRSARDHPHDHADDRIWPEAAARLLENSRRRKRGGQLLAQGQPPCQNRYRSGQVLRVLSGSGLDLVQHDRHPDTNAALIGFQIPHWQRIIDTVIEAARLMQHVPMIGWDANRTGRRACHR